MDLMPELDLYEINGRAYVSAFELYTSICRNRKYYQGWLRINITEQPQNLPVKGRDYIDRENLVYKGKRGPRSVDFFISISFAKELCYSNKTNDAKKVREWLYSLKSA